MLMRYQVDEQQARRRDGHLVCLLEQLLLRLLQRDAALLCPVCCLLPVKLQAETSKAFKLRQQRKTVCNGERSACCRDLLSTCKQHDLNACDCNSPPARIDNECAQHSVLTALHAQMAGTMASAGKCAAAATTYLLHLRFMRRLPRLLVLLLFPHHALQ